MRTITKRTEPASLTRHRLTPGSNYDDYPNTDKNRLRTALVTEQQGLCCYCMSHIRNEPDKMKIEHWHCKAHYPYEQLDYRNLLGACLGGKGLPPKLQHCDTRKGDSNLLWNPAYQAHNVQAWIIYGTDGTIKSNNCEFDQQLNEVLNLNLPLLKNNRKGVLDAILKWWREERRRWKRKQKPVPRWKLEQIIAKRSPSYGDLEPYNQVVICWLEKKLKRMPQ